MGSIFTIFTILRFYRNFIIFSTRIISSSKPSRVATFACDSIYTGPHSTPQSPLTSTSTIHNHRHIRSLQVSFTLSLSLTWCWWPDARHSLHCRVSTAVQTAGCRERRKCFVRWWPREGGSHPVQHVRRRSKYDLTIPIIPPNASPPNLPTPSLQLQSR